MNGSLEFLPPVWLPPNRGFGLVFLALSRKPPGSASEALNFGEKKKLRSHLVHSVSETPDWWGKNEY